MLILFSMGCVWFFFSKFDVFESFFKVWRNFSKLFSCKMCFVFMRIATNDSLSRFSQFRQIILYFNFLMFFKFEIIFIWTLIIVFKILIKLILLHFRLIFLNKIWVAFFERLNFLYILKLFLHVNEVIKCVAFEFWKFSMWSEHTHSTNDLSFLFSNFCSVEFDSFLLIVIDQLFVLLIICSPSKLVSNLVFFYFNKP